MKITTSQCDASSKHLSVKVLKSPEGCCSCVLVGHFLCDSVVLLPRLSTLLEILFQPYFFSPFFFSLSPRANCSGTKAFTTTFLGCSYFLSCLFVAVGPSLFRPLCLFINNQISISCPQSISSISISPVPTRCSGVHP